VLAARPSFRAGLRRLCFVQHRRTSGLGARAAAALLRIARPVPTSPMAFSNGGRAVAVATSVGVGSVGRDFLGGNPAALAAVIGLARAVTGSSNRPPVQPAAHASTLFAGRRPTLKGFYARDGVPPPRAAADLRAFRGRSIFEIDSMSDFLRMGATATLRVRLADAAPFLRRLSAPCWLLPFANGVITGERIFQVSGKRIDL